VHKQCGYLADKTNRVRLLCAVVALGHIPCLFTYFVTQFWQFFALRVLTGAALGGAVPLVFSLLGDLFPVGQRAAMAAAVQIALGGGVSGGQLLAGLLGPATNWRVPYLIVAAPSIAIALIVLLTIRDPPRCVIKPRTCLVFGSLYRDLRLAHLSILPTYRPHTKPILFAPHTRSGAYEEALQAQYAEGVAYAETITWAKAKAALRCRSNLLLMAVAVPGCLPWGVIGTFLVDYLAQEQGFSVQLATVVLTVFNIGGGAGLVGGGAAGQLLYNWRKEWCAAFLYMKGGGTKVCGVRTVD
jgi:MFS family permease